MKIAQLHPYPPEYEDQIPILPRGATQGGSETSSFRYALKLAEAGHQVTYYVAWYPGITKKSLKIGSNFEMIYERTFFKNMGLVFSFRLFFKLLTGDYGVIQSHQIPTMFSFIGGLAARLRNRPFIITFHGRLPYAWPDRFVGWLASCMARAVTVQNQYAYDLVKGFVPNKKLLIIPHGIDTDLFQHQPPDKKLVKKYSLAGKKTVLFVGRLIEPKGVDVLIEAAKLCTERDKSIRFLIAGSGNSEKSFRQLAAKLRLQKSVIFVGGINQEELPAYYSIADVFVLPSTYHTKAGVPIPNVSENFGLVLAEAMSSEVPIIASRVGGIPLWIKDGKTGLLFKERDARELADLIVEVVDGNAAKRRKMIVAAKKEIDSTYSWTAVIKRFEPLFRRA